MQQKPFFFFFWSSPKLEGKILKFWTEIKLIRLTKLCKTVLPPRNMVDQQKLYAYDWAYPSFLM